jgi:hypothetical protein
MLWGLRMLGEKLLRVWGAIVPFEGDIDVLFISPLAVEAPQGRLVIVPMEEDHKLEWVMGKLVGASYEGYEGDYKIAYGD